MTIAPTLQEYLARKNIVYDVLAHPVTTSSMPTAEVCHIPADNLAKGVVLRTREGYVLAVLAASDRIGRADLKQQLGEDFSLASEGELDELFGDCAHGAVPAVGECYGLDALVEESICDRPDVYFEAGDHSTVVHMSQAEFARLVEHVPHRRFGIHN